MFKQIEEYRKAASIMPGSVLGFQLKDDNSMNVLFYSQKAQEITGMEQDEINQTINEDGLNMIIDADRKVIIDKIKYSIEHKTDLDVIYRQHHKSHGMVWIHMKATISGELDGKPVFIATMLDVTTEMLSSSNIMEATDRCICVIEKNSKLMLYANTKFYDLIGRTPSECIGLYCHDVLCGYPAYGTDNNCLCFSTINIDKPFEYYNSVSNKYLSMYGRDIMWGEHEAYVFFLVDQTEEKFKEKQLKNAQKRFEMTLENSDLYIWEYDIINSQCINPQKAVKEYGLPPIINNYPESLFKLGHTPPETIEQIKDVKQRLLNGETGFSVERRTINADGNSQWMKVFYTLETDANGRPARALVCGRDITDQKKKENFYEEELRLKKTVTSDKTVLAVLNLTKNNVIENDTRNPILSSFLNLGAVDNVMNAICNEFISPADREGYRKQFCREKMLSDYEHGVMHGSFRHQFVNRSGWYESAYDLLLNPTTGEVEAIASIKDVSDMVRSKQVLNKLTAIDYDTIMTIDVKTEQIYLYNKGQISGADTGEHLNAEDFKKHIVENAKKYCTPEEAQKLIDDTKTNLVTDKLKTTPIYTMTYLMNINGKQIRKRNIYTYLDDSKNTILCATQDVTESYLQEEKQRKELSDALKKAEVANKAKTMFLSRVSHDMRTPLNGVLGLTSLLKDEAVNPIMLNDLKQLEISGKYLLNLINDVLDVSSIESGKLELHPTVCDGNEILKNVVNLSKYNMDAKNIKFKIDTTDFVFAKTWIDESRLQQIAMNILGNAAKFTPEGGLVELKCKTLSSTNDVLVNEFIVQDTGIGMSKDFLPHIFEPFSQENINITNSKTGTGLGLSIVQKIIELMDGSITVESKKGKGTTFIIIAKFPIATEEQIKQVKKTEAQPVTNYHLEGKHILLCEDHPLNKEIAKRILEKVGVIVDHAENGKLGIEKFENSSVGYYDAILMDVRMPVMDGLEASRTIRQLKRTDAKNIPILAMTANALDEDVRNTAKAGMNAHLSKPIMPQRLYMNLDKYTNKS